MELKTCTVNDCGGAHKAKGLCDAHYRAEKRKLRQLELANEASGIPSPSDIDKAWRLRLRPKT